MDGNQDEMQITKNEIAELKAMMARVVSLLEDDERTGRKGIYSELQNVKARVSELEITNKITMAKKGLLVFIGGLIVGVISWAIKFFYQ